MVPAHPAAEERAKRFGHLFSYRIPAVVFSRDLHPDKVFLRAAEKAQVPMFITPHDHDEVHQPGHPGPGDALCAARQEMGSMVDILGVGVIIRGESGIGKSESVLALDRARLQPGLRRRDAGDAH